LDGWCVIKCYTDSVMKEICRLAVVLTSGLYKNNIRKMAVLNAFAERMCLSINSPKNNWIDEKCKITIRRKPSFDLVQLEDNSNSCDSLTCLGMGI